MMPRLILGLAGLAYLLLPVPTPVSFGGVLAIAGAAVGVSAIRRPGSVAPLGLLAVGALEWLVVVDEPGWLRAVGFGLTGFVVHRAAALASVVPAGGAVAGLVLWPWALGTAGAMLVGAALVAATAPLADQPNSTGLVVGGLLAAGLLLGLPAVVGRRPRP